MGERRGEERGEVHACVIVCGGRALEEPWKDGSFCGVDGVHGGVRVPRLSACACLASQHSSPTAKLPRNRRAYFH